MGFNEIPPPDRVPGVGDRKKLPDSLKKKKKKSKDKLVPSDVVNISDEAKQDRAEADEREEERKKERERRKEKEGEKEE